MSYIFKVNKDALVDEINSKNGTKITPDMVEFTASPLNPAHQFATQLGHNTILKVTPAEGADVSGEATITMRRFTLEQFFTLIQFRTYTSKEGPITARELFEGIRRYNGIDIDTSIFNATGGGMPLRPGEHTDFIVTIAKASNPYILPEGQVTVRVHAINPSLSTFMSTTIIADPEIGREYVLSEGISESMFYDLDCSPIQQEMLWGVINSDNEEIIRRFLNSNNGHFVESLYDWTLKSQRSSNPKYNWCQLLTSPDGKRVYRLHYNSPTRDAEEV